MKITSKNINSVFKKARKKLEENNVDYKKLITELITPHGRVKIEWLGGFEVRTGNKKATEWLEKYYKKAKYKLTKEYEEVSNNLCRPAMGIKSRVAKSTRKETGEQGVVLSNDAFGTNKRITS